MLDENNVSTAATPPSGVSRRTVAKGAAWAVPTIMAASAAPAFAVSPGEVTMEMINVACKLPGASCLDKTGVKKGYLITAIISNFTTLPVYVTVRDGMLKMGTEPAQTWEVGLGSQSVPTSCATWMYVQDPADPTDSGLTSSPQVADGNNNEILNDVRVQLPAGTATAPTQCTVSFGFGGDSSANVSLTGTVPYSWVSTDGTLVGPSNLNMIVSSATTPPCNACVL